MKPTKKPTPLAGSDRFRLVRLLLIAGLISAAVLGGIYLYPSASLSDDERLALAREALRVEDFLRAQELAAGVAEASPRYGESRIVAGEAAMRSGNYDASIEYFQAISPRDSERAVVAAFSLGELYRTRGKLSASIDAFQRVLASAPGNGEAHARLAFLCSVSGQRWEAMPHYQAMISAQAWTLDSLALLGDLERPLEQPEFLAECSSQAPDDPLVMLGLAVEAHQQGDEARALQLVRDVLVRRPQLVAAQSLLGELLLAGEPAEWDAWEKGLPPGGDDHPDIWFVRGMQARARNDLPRAAGCFAEAVRLRPEYRSAMYQLGQVLTLLDHPAAPQFVARGEQLVQLTQKLDTVLKSRGQAIDAIRGVVEILVDVGRYQEGWAWATMTQSVYPEATWTAGVIGQVTPFLRAGEPATHAAKNLMAQHPLEQYRQVARRDAQPATRAAVAENPSSGGAQSTAALRFQTAEVGIDFVYASAADPATPGARMFEQTGGGVGVLDFDLDGWPDLYFTQGGRWPTGAKVPEPDPAYTDHLYRNLAGERMVECAAAAGIEGLEFSQGVAVGDYDADGFPDLFVSNIGRNRLWRNNGDGTFSDATEGLQGDPQLWTTSAAFADFSGDGLADLYAVDYLMGEDVYERICGNRGCSPKVFAGAPDEFYLNQGDGTFRRLPGITPEVDAKGLGLVVARFGDDPFLSVFIANDQVPNFFLQPEADPEQGLRFVDRALLRGLAYNVDGLAMACMGIAADDLDGNRRLDLLVTNFKDEPNTLYLQDAPGLFVDATRTSGLQGPSYPYVGWGTQFLDADLDGQSDLVVTNGHIDDYRDEGGMYQMPPHLFLNRGRGRFVQIPAAAAGDFFEGSYLGRGLAKLDWNRDGKVDFAVSSIGQRASLVSNRTGDEGSHPGVGNYFNLRLFGTLSPRDPVGAMVEVRGKGAGREGLEMTKQWVAGDGYQATNERVLQFGLGANERVERLIVRWPSGLVTEIRDMPVGTTAMIVEGARRGWMEDGQPWSGTVLVPSKPEGITP